MKDVGTKTVRAFATKIEEEYGVPVHLVKERTGTVASVVMAEMIAELLKGK
jgi:RNase H-fold protein (predicted Holliday junction resolvase)